MALIPVPTPTEEGLLWRTELRLPNPGGAAREELVEAAVELFSDRLLRGTDRREGAEL